MNEDDMWLLNELLQPFKLEAEFYQEYGIGTAGPSEIKIQVNHSTYGFLSSRDHKPHYTAESVVKRIIFRELGNSKQ